MSTNKTREHETTFNDEDGHNNKKRKTKEKTTHKGHARKAKVRCQVRGLEERMKEFTRVKGENCGFFFCHSRAVLDH